MVKKSVLTSVKRYLAALKKAGLGIELIVIFGSQVTGKDHKWSDIDLLVISPQFDEMKNRVNLNLLWRIAAKIDDRIEPIPCGSKQWQEDNINAIIEIARREGQILTAA